ncbi:hypothetical protein BDN70DRAFT_875247 [Pholiota conissans]|uniref:Uncharacterized protein n=1 Tax=Pholiota conissans TaxID=109636 RepID=A0A9P5Z8T7_9AGAR|nr:hypothetical protein BDN70DRAFT_875247 [Pholiota conissans]
MASEAYDQQLEDKQSKQQQNPKQRQMEMDAERARLCEAQKAFGTNSPPLEATGSARPMGMASVEGDIEAGYVPDYEQRKAYFGGDVRTGDGATEGERGRKAKAQARKVAQSLAAEMDERT